MLQCPQPTSTNSAPRTGFRPPILSMPESFFLKMRSVLWTISLFLSSFFPSSFPSILSLYARHGSFSFVPALTLFLYPPSSSPGLSFLLIQAPAQLSATRCRHSLLAGSAVFSSDLTTFTFLLNAFPSPFLLSTNALSTRQNLAKAN